MRQASTGLRVAVLAVALALVPTLAPAQSIQSDYDRSYDFSGLKTYAFAPQTRGPNDPLGVNPLNDRRVRTALDSQLVARGFVRDTSGTPDFLVAYHAAARNRVGVQDWGYGLGRLGSRRIDVDQYTQGTLIVDMVDAVKRELIWRGTATGTIELDEVEKKIREAVGKLVERFSKDTRPRR